MWASSDPLVIEELNRLREENARKDELLSIASQDQECLRKKIAQNEADWRNLREENARLRDALERVTPVGDIAEGVAQYYIHSDTIKRIRAALASASKGE